MTALPPVPVKTPVEKKLTDLDKRDKLFRIYTILVLSIVILFVIFSTLSLRTMAKDNNRNVNQHNAQVQGLLQENRNREREQVQRDEKVHEELRRYIECIVLIRFNLTPEQQQDQEAVKTALKDCAANSKIVALAGDEEVTPAKAPLRIMPGLPVPKLLPPDRPAPQLAPAPTAPGKPEVQPERCVPR